MEISLKWITDNIIDEEYLNILKNLYPDLETSKILLLNIELRMLYLKYILVIENNLKHILLQKIRTQEANNNNKILDYNSNENWENYKEFKKLVTAGYNKYTRNHILKNKSMKNLVKVMSFEWTMKFLEILNKNSLKEIANYFNIEEANNSEVLIFQLNYLKDMRNYFSHNFKILGSNFAPKNSALSFLYYKEPNEVKKHYLNFVISNFSKNILILPNFEEEYQNLLDSYNIKKI